MDRAVSRRLRQRRRLRRHPGKAALLLSAVERGGGAIDMVAHARSCTAVEAVEFITGGGGRSSQTREAPTSSAARAPCDPMKTWRNALTFRMNSAACLYLDHRGFILSAAEALSIRCSPDLWHWPTQSRCHAMLARVSLADGTDLSTHQTYLTPDGRKAPFGEQARLFPAGSKTAGGGVWLGEIDENREFGVAEGLENALATMRIYGCDAGCAALSAFGLSRLVLPPAARKVRLFADHDAFGQGLASARVAVQRWRAEGREVALVMSPNVGEDANDVWLRRQSR